MGNFLWFLPLIVALAMGCEHQAITFSHDGFGPIQEDFSGIANPRARWQAYQLQDYMVTQQRFCFCGPPEVYQVVVKNNQITQILGSQGKIIPADESFMTIDQIFSWMDTLQQRNPAKFEVEYHPRFGYPAMIDLDESVQVADDELTLRLDALRKLRK